MIKLKLITIFTQKMHTTTAGQITKMLGVIKRTLGATPGLC